MDITRIREVQILGFGKMFWRERPQPGKNGPSWSEARTGDSGNTHMAVVLWVEERPLENERRRARSPTRAMHQPESKPNAQEGSLEG